MGLSTGLNKSVPSNFQLVFPVLPAEVSIETSRELTLNVYGSVIPSINLENLEVGWLGGKIQVQSGKLNMDPLTINFVVDSELRNWRTLVNWVFFINNNIDTFAKLGTDQSVDATLKISDNFNKEILRVIFRNVWIQTVGEITLSMREGENTLESSATFLYDRYEIL
jgi:hypothetical protein